LLAALAGLLAALLLAWLALAALLLLAGLAPITLLRIRPRIALLLLVLLVALRLLLFVRHQTFSSHCERLPRRQMNARRRSGVPGPAAVSLRNGLEYQGKMLWSAAAAVAAWSLPC
jgi:hypothetical protein